MPREWSIVLPTLGSWTSGSGRITSPATLQHSQHEITHPLGVYAKGHVLCFCSPTSFRPSATPSGLLAAMSTSPSAFDLNIMHPMPPETTYHPSFPALSLLRETQKHLAYKQEEADDLYNKLTERDSKIQALEEELATALENAASLQSRTEIQDGYIQKLEQSTVEGQGTIQELLENIAKERETRRKLQLDCDRADEALEGLTDELSRLQTRPRRNADGHVLDVSRSTQTDMGYPESRELEKTREEHSKRTSSAPSLHELSAQKSPSRELQEARFSLQNSPKDPASQSGQLIASSDGNPKHSAIAQARPLRRTSDQLWNARSSWAPGTRRASSDVRMATAASQPDPLKPPPTCNSTSTTSGRAESMQDGFDINRNDSLPKSNSSAPGLPDNVHACSAASLTEMISSVAASTSKADQVPEVNEEVRRSILRQRCRSNYISTGTDAFVYPFQENASKSVEMVHQHQQPTEASPVSCGLKTTILVLIAWALAALIVCLPAYLMCSQPPQFQAVAQDQRTQLARCHAIEAMCQLFPQPEEQPFFVHALDSWNEHNDSSAYCPPPPSCLRTIDAFVEPSFDQLEQEDIDWRLDIANGLQDAYLSLMDPKAYNDQLHPAHQSLYSLWWDALLFRNVVLLPQQPFQSDAADKRHLRCVKALKDVSWTVGGHTYLQWHKAAKARVLQHELKEACERMMAKSGEAALVVL